MSFCTNKGVCASLSALAKEPSCHRSATLIDIQQFSLIKWIFKRDVNLDQTVLSGDFICFLAVRNCLYYRCLSWVLNIFHQEKECFPLSCSSILARFPPLSSGSFQKSCYAVSSSQDHAEYGILHFLLINFMWFVLAQPESFATNCRLNLCFLYQLLPLASSKWILEAFQRDQYFLLILINLY